MQPEHGCAITGWASALPSTVVTNQDIMTLFDTTDEWIVERTGHPPAPGGRRPLRSPQASRLAAPGHGHDRRC